MSNFENSQHFTGESIDKLSFLPNDGTTADIIISADGADPGNNQAIVASNIKVAVLTPRCANLGYPRASKEELDAQWKKEGSKALLARETDKSCQDSVVMTDSIIVALVAALAIYQDVRDVGREIRVYLLEKSFASVGVVIAPEHHYPDYTARFNNAEKALYDGAVATYRGEPFSSKGFPMTMRDLCLSHIARVSRELGLGPKNILHDFNHLITNNKKANIQAKWIAVGPLTELNHYLDSGGELQEVFFQGGTDHLNNVSTESFNFKMDMESTKACLSRLQMLDCRVRGQPTQFAKTSFAFTRGEVDDMLQNAPKTLTRVKAYHERTGPHGLIVPFDLVLWWCFKNPDKFAPLSLNSYELEEKDGVERFRWKEDPGGRFEMYKMQLDEQWLEEERKNFVDFVRKSLKERNVER